jgi:hypothetical protein
VSTTLGIIAGMVLTLAMAFITVVSINAAGFEPDARWAVAGGTAPTPAPEGTEDPFRSLDHNGDGKLALAEAAGEADLVTKFSRADRNKDGMLTKAEYERLLKLKDQKKRPKPKRSSP